MTRRGLSLIELLVVIAVIAILLALLIPAVMRAHAAALRMQCAAKLRQIGIACQTYQATYRCYPPGLILEVGGLASLFSPHAMLLPNLDQLALYNSLNFKLRFDSPANTSAARTLPSAFLCPADSTPQELDPKAQGNFTNYAACFGSGNWDHLFDGLFGPPQRNGFVTPSSVTDGLSQTACFSEWLRGHYTGLRLDPNPDGSGLQYAIMQLPASRDEFTDWCSGTHPAIANKRFGGPWLLGGAGNSWYNHQLTPGHRSCMIVGTVYPAGDAFSAFTAGSRHSGGVNLLLADGHVRFVSNHIDLTLWRALGSKDGGETVSDQF